MAIRTTQSAVSADFLTQTQNVYANMAKTQSSINSGLAITKPSDDPFGAGQVINYDAELSDLKRYESNTASAMDYMGAADTALGSISDALRQINVLAVKAQGDKTPTDLATIAQQIAQLKETVRDGANAQFGNQYIFGGTATTTQPYPAPANTYMGTANTIQTRIGANQTVTINASGTTAFGTSPSNVFDLIDKLVTDVQSGNVANITTSTQALQTAANQVIDTRTNLGATADRLEVTRDRLSATEERITSARSQVAEVDPTAAYIKFNQQQNAYQAALSSGTRMMSTSILDFLH